MVAKIQPAKFGIKTPAGISFISWLYDAANHVVENKRISYKLRLDTKRWKQKVEIWGPVGRRFAVLPPWWPTLREASSWHATGDDSFFHNEETTTALLPFVDCSSYLEYRM